MAGSQPSAMKARPVCPSSFHGPLPPEVFPPRALCGLPYTPTKTVSVQLVGSHIQQYPPKGSKNLQKSHDATGFGSVTLVGIRPGSINN